MIELIRTNDPVFLSWLVSSLAGAGIEAVVLDNHTSVLEGSVIAIQRRIMVMEADGPVARRIVAEGEALGAAPDVTP